MGVRFWLAFAALGVGCSNPPVPSIYDDAGAPVFDPCPDESRWQVVLTDVLTPRERVSQMVLYGPDAFFLNGDLMRRRDGAWVWEDSLERQFFALQADGDVVLGPHASLHRPAADPLGRLEQIRRPFSLPLVSTEVMGADVDGQRLAFVTWTTPRLYVVDEWDTPVEEAFTLELDWEYSGLGFALDGDWIVLRERFGGLPVYHRTAAGWERTQRLRTAGDIRQIALEDDMLVAGPAINSTVETFRFHDGLWRRGPILSPTVERDQVQSFGTYFGQRLRLAGDRLAIASAGARYCGSPNGRGAVFLYRREGNDWLLEHVVLPPDGHATESFGWDIDFDGRVLLVSDPHSNAYGQPVEGSANGVVFRFELVD
ncbi:MAG: hypothetical protein H6721_17740 [Sandaracinus sp.]|nr:hypothetical protein [Sandaracinus sp.]MCB9633965.1 hypothetical protein [Sandaracinus sp.]